MKRISFFILLMVLITGLLVGCDELLEDGDIIEEEGNLSITAIIPEELQGAEVETLYLGDISLNEVVFTVEKDDQSFTETVEPEREIEVVFPELSSGNWEVTVEAVDTEDNKVALGTETATVAPDTTTDIDIEMELVNGDIELSIIVFEEDVDSVEIILEDLIGDQDIEETISDPDEEINLNFTDLAPRKWNLKVIIDDQISAQKDINVLPGRTAVVEISFDQGDLTINVTWDLPPASPLNVMAEYIEEDGEIVVSWDQVDEADGYLVYRGIDDDEKQSRKYIAKVEEPGTEFTDQDIEKGKPYNYWIVSYRGEFTSAFSFPASVATDVFSVSGVVVDEDGTGLEGIELVFYCNVSAGIVETDADGYFAISGLEGEVTITPDEDNYYFEPYNITVDEETDDIIFVAYDPVDTGLSSDYFGLEDGAEQSYRMTVETEDESDEIEFTQTIIHEETKDGMDIFKVEQDSDWFMGDHYRTRYNNKYSMFDNYDQINNPDLSMFAFEAPINEGDTVIFDGIELEAKEKIREDVQAGTFDTWIFYGQEEFEYDDEVDKIEFYYGITPYLGILAIYAEVEVIDKETGETLETASIMLELTDYDFN